MQTIWKIKEQKKISKEILEAAGSELLAQLLLQRNIDTPSKIADFLNPSQMKITSPFVFTDMEKTVSRIFEAIEKQEQIIVYGDFDADGVTSTSLLLKTLKHLGAKVDFYIPNREKENHGLNTNALVNLISKHKAKLIITVDCGVSDVAQVHFAKCHNADVIITDHHETPEVLPDAYSIINPKAFNALKEDLSIEEIDALNQLAGVGVAFKLACALLEKKNDFDFAQELLPFVAVGTIADVVPILYENRAFVEAGLKHIENNSHYGLSKLLEVSGCDMKNGVSSENIAFGVAPRINAAGRLDTVDNAVKLLISENKAEIDLCAEELNNLNTVRQSLCDKIFNDAVEMLKNEPPQESIILYNEDWHIGIIGIVASKLVEKFYKPVFLMTKDKKTGLIRCSARSIAEVHLRDAIAENEHYLEHYGGHAQAAGLVFDSTKSSFETVKQALNNTIKNAIDGRDLKPSLLIDMEIEPKHVTLELLEDLKRLEPLGEMNKAPLFAAKDLVLETFRTMGSSNNHLKFFCSKEEKNNFECVYWNHSELNIPQGKPLDIAFYPKLNVFNGVTTIQFDVQDVKSEFVVQPTQSDYTFYDHRKKTNIFNLISDEILTTKLSTVVFAQNKTICDALKPYKIIAEKICARKNLPKCSQIMFFDFPASENIMNEIRRKTGAKIFYFMNYNNKIIDAQDLVKNISGMLKFVDKNKNGEFLLGDISDFLSLTDEIVALCLDIFEAAGMVEIVFKKENFYKIKFLCAVNFSKIKENEMFEELQTELKNVFDYRNKLCSLPVEDVFQ